MNTQGYKSRKLYDTFRKWWSGDGFLSDVEQELGAKWPFLQDFLFQSGVLDSSGSFEADVTFQDAFNILVLYLALLALKSRAVKPFEKR